MCQASLAGLQRLTLVGLNKVCWMCRVACCHERDLSMHIFVRSMILLLSTKSWILRIPSFNVLYAGFQPVTKSGLDLDNHGSWQFIISTPETPKSICTSLTIVQKATSWPRRVEQQQLGYTFSAAPLSLNNACPLGCPMYNLSLLCSHFRSRWIMCWADRNWGSIVSTGTGKSIHVSQG